jgi:hypothetical protein
MLQGFPVAFSPGFGFPEESAFRVDVASEFHFILLDINARKKM